MSDYNCPAVNEEHFIKRLTLVLNEAAQTRMFGDIEISVRDGKATAIHTRKTDRLGNPGENPRHDRNYK